MNSMKIYVTYTFTSDEKRVLEDGLDPACTICYATEASESERRAAFLEADVVLGNPPPAWLLEAPRLRWVQLYSAGYNAYLDLDWSQLGERLIVTNMHGLFADPAAETALAGILYFLRGFDLLLDLQLKQQWKGFPVRQHLRTLAGERALVLGPGTIGLALRKRLEASGCEVVVYGRTSPEADLYTLEALDAHLPEMEVVASCLPENAATRGIFSRERLARLKPGAVFANVGRGSAVDEDALLDMLKAGRLRGAVLDVTQEEPLPATHPFWQMPRVLLTQHSAGGRYDEQVRKIEVFLDNFRRFRADLPLRYQVRLG